MALLLAAFAAGCAPASHGREDAVIAADARRPPSGTLSSCDAAAVRVERPDLCAFPRDVQAYVIQRDLCDHFRSEPWPGSDARDDVQRERELRAGMLRTCRGTDRALARLRIRHAGDRRVVALLARFEDRVEP